MIQHTFHIHIQGIVQGVGFRPYVFRLAEQFLLRARPDFSGGTVCNAADGVHIEINADATTAHDFYQNLLHNATILSKITHSNIEKIEEKFFDGFKIIHSDNGKKANLLLTPDFAICENCKKDLKNPQNHRFQYPFITCTNCGPRYSIIKKLPYDRDNTTMDVFKMCPTCEIEYNDVRDRRFYSQTNSCKTCGIELQQLGSYENRNELEPSLDTIIDAIKNGKIIAIKGIGGYLLMCDATNETAIKTLRERKHRPTKPFAVIYPSLEILENDVILKDIEKEALQSPEAPIVLLNLKNEVPSGIKTELIAPKLSQIGAMLPYTPLFALITEGVGKPLIATSGNISGSPIIFKDEKTAEYLSEIADLVVSNNREIVVPQDDSVVKFSYFKSKKIIIRRSRGIAPTYLQKSVPPLEAVARVEPQKSALGLGAMMKSCFSWAHEGNIYVSQYLGDLESYDTQESFEHTLNHFLHLFNDKPQRIITDKHPDYFSTQLGERLANEWGIPLSKVQHHKAHFTAVMAENGLLEEKEPILGVIWDGTGLGDDGNIWGGEFFKYQNGDFLRAYYFDYFPLILGDKMPKEPRISALSLAHDVYGADEILAKKFSNTEGVLYRKLLKQEGVLQTSSVGRLFDGVASLLDLGDKMSYEGEAAMLLEDLALSFFKKHGLDFNESYISEGSSYYRVPTKTLIQNIVFDIKNGTSRNNREGKNRDLIAAKFHISLVKIIQKVAKNVGCKKLAFSGGVFQNSLLVDLIIHHLDSEFELFFHQQLSPNDECISFGQLFSR
jgi:hydrogenase maturation protein HypF